MSDSLQFRATLCDSPPRERSLTTYHATLEHARAWAKVVLPSAKGPGAAVAIYQQVEQQVDLIVKGKE